MLKMMRSGANSPVFKTLIFGLLTAGAVGLAVTGGHSFIQNAAGNQAVATIGRTKIEAAAFDANVRRALSRQGLDTHTAYQLGYINQLLQAQVNGTLVSLAARDAGLRIGDDLVAKQIRTLLEPFTSGGTKPSDALKAILRSQNMSESQLMEEMRGEMASTLMRGALQDGTAIPSEDEAADLALYQNETREIEYVLLSDSAVKDYRQPDDAVLKPFYEAGQERYAIPESRTFSIAILSPASAQAGAEVTDDDIRKAYDEQKDTLTIPESRTVDQAILSDEKQAQAVVDLEGRGGALKDAVKKATGDVKSWRGVQSFSREGLDKSVADAVFGAEKGKVAGPVHTGLGWHVFVVQDIVPARVPSLEEAGAKLKESLKADKSQDALYTLSTQVDDQLAGGASLEDVARTYHMDIVKIGPVRSDGSTPDQKDGVKDFAKDSGALLDAGFKLSSGETAPVIGLSDGRFAALRLDSATPKSYKPFEAVRDELSKVWIADQQKVLNRQKGEAILEKLKGGGSFQAASGAASSAMKITRGGKMDEPLTESARASLFDAAAGTPVMLDVKGGILIARVKSVTLPDIARVPKDQISKVVDASRLGTQEESMQTFVDSMRAKYKVGVNQAALDALYNRQPDGGADAADSSDDQ